MSNNIDSKKYILHYKVYKNSILYFQHNYLENDNFFDDEHAADGTIKVEKNEIFIGKNSILALYYDNPIPQIISKSNDFTIYFRIRLKNPSVDSVYHIIYDGLSLTNDNDKRNGNRYSFQIKIDKSYTLILKKGISGFASEKDIKELINVEVNALSDGKQHYIAISRYRGRLRAYLDGEKIYDLYALTKKTDKSEFFIPPIYTSDIVIGSNTTDAFFINDLVVCNNFAFYRNLNFDIIPEDIIDPDNTYINNVITNDKKNYTIRDVRITLDGDKSIKYHTERNVTSNIFKSNTRRNIRRKFEYRFNTVLISGTIDVLEKIKVIRNIHTKYVYKFDTLIRNAVLFDKNSNNNKSATRRILSSELWDYDKKSKGRRFNTKRIITYLIKVLLKSNTKRKIVIDPKANIYKTKRIIIHTGTKDHPSSINATRRDIHEDYYLLNHTNVMVRLLLENITKRNVVISETKSYDTRRHIKSYSRQCMTFVYNTNINVDNPYNMSKNYISYFIYGKRAKND